MNQPAKCPFCGSPNTFPAQFFSDGSPGTLLRFPAIEQFPWWKFAGGANKDAIRDVGVEQPTACLACGMLWAKYDLSTVVKLVERYGSPEIKAALPS